MWSMLLWTVSTKYGSPTFVKQNLRYYTCTYCVFKPTLEQISSTQHVNLSVPLLGDLKYFRVILFRGWPKLLFSERTSLMKTSLLGFTLKLMSASLWGVFCTFWRMCGGNNERWHLTITLSQDFSPYTSFTYLLTHQNRGVILALPILGVISPLFA